MRLPLPLTHACAAAQPSHMCPKCVQGFELSSWDALEGTAARGARARKARWGAGGEEVRPETPPGRPSVEPGGTQSGSLTRSEPGTARGKREELDLGAFIQVALSHNTI